MKIKKFEEIKNELKNIILSKQNKLTDFNEGSVISSICEAVALVVEQFYIDVRNGYVQALNAIAQNIFGFKRKNGSKATAEVIFSRSKASELETIIPINTVVSSGSYKFTTSAVGVIKAGELESNKVTVQAEEIGQGYNVFENTITSIDSVVPADVISVNNPGKATGGSDEENDVQMQARFKMYINGLQGGNVYGMKSAIMAIDGVRSLSIDEHFPPVDNVYGFTVYIDDGTGGLTTKLKNEVEKVIDGDNTSAYPGHRAAGVIGRVLNATVVPVTLKLKCYTYRIEDAKAIIEIKQALQDEINSLGINENVVLTSLILRLRRLSYVKDVKIEEPVDNVKIGISQIARFESAEIEIEAIT